MRAVIAFITVVTTFGCSPAAEDSGSPFTTAPGTGAAPGSGGTTGTGAVPGAGGMMMMTGTGASDGAGGVSGTGAAPGAGGSTMDDPLAVKPSAGCGMDPGQNVGDWVEYGLPMTGMKDGEGTWNYTRQYFIRLPAGYDNTKPYTVVLQGPGCGGKGQNVYPLSTIADQIIKVGLSPQDGVHEGNCFDDKEGDDSIEWPFYEAVVNHLRTTMCIDENRIIASGNSSGAWLGNELACIYGSNTEGYQIRGIGVNTGGLPQGAESPTCNGGPFAGMWIHEVGDTVNPFSGNIFAIERAMRVNGCGGTDYATAPKEDYVIQATGHVCQKISGCPAAYPLVVCELPGSGHGSHDDVADPGFAQFFSEL